MSSKLCLCLGAIFGAVSVSLGALGAHGLEKHLDQSIATLRDQKIEYAQAEKAVERKLASWETAARYQMAHALALLAIGLLMTRGSSRWLSAAAWAFIAGVLMFSGGLYGYVLTDVKPLVHVVPIGGIMFIVGWGLLAVGAWGATD